MQSARMLRVPHISPSDCLNNDAGKSIIFFVTSNIFVKKPKTFLHDARLHFALVTCSMKIVTAQLCKPLFGTS
jgi:hypothetical protein